MPCIISWYLGKSRKTSWSSHTPAQKVALPVLQSLVVLMLPTRVRKSSHQRNRGQSALILSCIQYRSALCQGTKRLKKRPERKMKRNKWGQPKLGSILWWTNNILVYLDSWLGVLAQSLRYRKGSRWVSERKRVQTLYSSFKNSITNE